MQARTIRAQVTIAALAANPQHKDRAATLTDEEACRIYSRARRAVYSGKTGYSLTEIVRKSRQRNRARQTHPGKRGRK